MKYALLYRPVYSQNSFKVAIVRLCTITHIHIFRYILYHICNNLIIISYHIILNNNNVEFFSSGELYFFFLRLVTDDSTVNSADQSQPMKIGEISASRESLDHIV